MSVCVTGATGFVGSHVVSAFLQAGEHVRATVRNPAKAAHLQALAQGAPGRLELVPADLLQPGSFDAAVAGCTGLIHVAAVAKLTAPDPQREIVDPAVEGVKNVLAAAEKSKTITRVVLTSSVAAIGGYVKAAQRPLTEADWNDEATLQRAPYEYAKTLEERTAWEITRRVGQWDMVSINPSLILGPVMEASHLRASPTVVRDLVVGTFPACPRFYFGIVDVRDVAQAHLEAWRRPEATGRYLMCAGGRWMQEMAVLLKTAMPDRKISTRNLPTFLLYLAALFDKRLSIQDVRDMAGIQISMEGGRVESLGVRYRSIDASIIDTATSMLPFLERT